MTSATRTRGLLERRLVASSSWSRPRITSPLCGQRWTVSGVMHLGPAVGLATVDDLVEATDGIGIRGHMRLLDDRGGTARVNSTARLRYMADVARRSRPRPTRSATIDPDHYRAVLGRFVTGITVVTTMADEDEARDPSGRPSTPSTPSRSTRRWCSSPSAVSAPSIRSSRDTGRFAVNILAEDGQELSDCFSGAPSRLPR